jgi:hypothetical protein
VGGQGSTRWGSRENCVPSPTVDHRVEIRASSLFRRVRPMQGRRLGGRLGSSSIGPIDFTIDGASWPVTLVLRFSDRLRAAGIQVPDDINFWLLPTQPTYGGQRWWIVCPVCGLRCGGVYRIPPDQPRQHGMPWACRRCEGLVYQSQREGKGDRALRRLRKVLGRAGAAWSPHVLPRRRPKGMHRRTFDRLYAEALVSLIAASGCDRTARVLRTGALWG